MDYSKFSLFDLEDIIVGQQEALCELYQRIAGHEYELRLAHRELERRLKIPVAGARG